jgi:uncharacterized protein
MKIVVAGGSGQLGQLLARDALAKKHDVVILARGASVPAGRLVAWDGRTLGAWASEIDGADVVINLAGRTVNCRYTEENLRQMMDSRVDSTRVIGEAIAAAANPPATWLQMSTATIYAHRIDAANDESTGILGGNEPDVPAYWKRSIDIAKAWEATLDEAKTPSTRKVAMRAAMVMSADRDGIFDVLRTLTRRGFGGAAGSGKQYVSWIHGDDFVRAVWFLIEHTEIDGAVNLASPGPLPHREFARALRIALNVRSGLPATKWMLEIGAFFMRTDTELLLKSRRVVPKRLLDTGFKFDHEDWQETAKALAAEHDRRA